MSEVEQVEAARIRLGLTQSLMASALGVSQPHYSKLAAGLASPSKDLAARMHAWLREVGDSAPSATDRRARELSISIKRQSRELAALLAGGRRIRGSRL